MNKREREVQQVSLDNEKAVLKELEKAYKDALKQINQKLEILMARQDADMAHVIYQIEYQKALKTQVQSILEELQAKEFETISEFLAQAYEDGFIGTMYNLQGQGIEMILPIDPEQMIEAIQHETALSVSLYESLGVDVKDLQKKISGEISRGIATGSTYTDIARNIAFTSKIPLNRAMTIARTESHRINNKAAHDAAKKVQEKGGDIVKVWVAILDNKVRNSHVKLDMQIKELDEPFEVNGHKAMSPGGFGRPEEDINCRCKEFHRARWLLDAGFQRYSEFEGKIVKEKDYHAYRERFKEESKKRDKNGEFIEKMNIEKPEKQLEKASENSPKTTEKLANSGGNGIMELSSRYLNKTDKLYSYAEKVEPIEGFYDVVTHGDPYSLIFKDSDNKETHVSAQEFVEILRKDPNYKGGNIRLVACQVGAGDGIVPQYIADKLGVEVLAPTEKVHLDFNGKMILADDDDDARANIETGEWKIFKPKER